MNISIGEPRKEYIYKKLCELDKGECFINAAHSPEKFSSGTDRVAIYMLVKIQEVDRELVIPGYKTAIFYAVNLRNGNLYSFTGTGSSGANMNCLMLNADLSLSLKKI